MSAKNIRTNSQHWCFTLNNPSVGDEERLLNLVDASYVIFGREKAPTTGTPHLQGYVSFKKQHRMNKVRDLLDNIRTRIHVEVALATDKDRCINYCKKGDQSKEEWKEFRELGPNFGLNASFEEKTWKKDGRKKDKNVFRDCIELAREGKNLLEIADHHPELVIKHHAGINKMIEEVKKESRQLEVQEMFANFKPLPWQEKLAEEINGDTDDRTIIWYVDKEGGCGKSIFCKWQMAINNAEYFTGGRSADIIHAWQGGKVIFFDFSRTVEEVTNYQAIEIIKNNMGFSPKFNSTSKLYVDNPHVIIFANWPPNLEALSKDRWRIRYLTPEKDGPNRISIASEKTTNILTENENIPAIEELSEKIVKILDVNESIPAVQDQTTDLNVIRSAEYACRAFNRGYGCKISSNLVNWFEEVSNEQSNKEFLDSCAVILTGDVMIPQ